MKNQVLLAPFWAILFSLQLATSAYAQDPPRTVEDYYVANGEKHFLSVSLAQVGVVLNEKVTERDAVEQFSKADFRESRKIGQSQLFVLQLSRNYSRQEIIDIGRDLKKKYPRLVLQTGLVATAPEYKNSFLVTNEIIVGLDPKQSKEEALAFGKSKSLQLAMENPFMKGNYLFTLSDKASVDPLTLSHQLLESGQVEYAYPNFVSVAEDNSEDIIPNDPLFPNQWHLNNTGQNGGTVDADADLPEAWDITTGAPGTIIAVFENGGFDMSHPDLRPNLWVNPGEIPGNGVDDDGNSLVDDINGWDFGACLPTPTSGCGDADPSPASLTTEDHGTAVAGVAGAAGDNMLGVSGSCPDCRLLMLRTSYDGTTNGDFMKSMAMGYASQSGAQIITNSWSFSGPLPNTVAAVNNVAVTGRGGAGTVVLFAAGNSSVNICNTVMNPPIASNPNVIAVSGSTNLDRKVPGAAFGNCVDILSPTNFWPLSSPSPGTLAITTTDRSGTPGYNNTNPSCPPGITEPADLDYTNCFGGTSSATPLAAGIVGLALTVNPSLTRVQVQNLLQDTGDKIEHSLGNYSPVNGFSTPVAGTATHAYGRINAFEAVRVVAPVADGGRGGVDIFLRDNTLDWGNTEQPSYTLFEPTRGTIGWWRSMDVKVDAPPFAPAPTAATFDSFVDENPLLGTNNRVYVRVRNRGPVTASSVTVKVQWAQFGTSLPALAGDFWTAFPADPALPQSWTSMGTVTLDNLAYSGASVAGTGADAAQVAMFTFAPAFDPLLTNHYCLLAMVDSPQDPVSSGFTSGVVDAVTPRNNNVAHRNYVDLELSEDGDMDELSFFVRNPFDRPIRSTLTLDAPKGWQASLGGLTFNQPFSLEPGEEKLVSLDISSDDFDKPGEITVTQHQVEPEKTPMGGFTLNYAPTHPDNRDTCGCDGVLSPYLIGTWDLRKNNNTVLQVVNPTGRFLRFTVAYLDDDENFIKCFESRLSPNDMEEIDVSQLFPAGGFGVVKIISKDMQVDEPESGLVAFKRQFYRSGWWCWRRFSVTESALMAIPSCVLYGDYKRILEGCN